MQVAIAQLLDFTCDAVSILHDHNILSGET
jgi:hypothetical protein